MDGNHQKLRENSGKMMLKILYEPCLYRLKKKFSHQNEYLYKKFRNQVVNELRTSKIEYYKQYFTEHKSSMKMLWSGIKCIINIKNNRFYNILQIVQNGKVINN